MAFSKTLLILCVTKAHGSPHLRKYLDADETKIRPFHTPEAGRVGKVEYLGFLVVVSGEEGRGRDREELEAGGKVGSRSSRFLSTTNRKKYWSCQEDWLDNRY